MTSLSVTNILEILPYWCPVYNSRTTGGHQTLELYIDQPPSPSHTRSLTTFLETPPHTQHTQRTRNIYIIKKK